MRLFVLLLLISCKQQPEKKKYYIEISQKAMYVTGYEDRVKRDSVLLENDSLAFWEGIRTYTAHLITDKLLKDKGIKNLTSITKDFDVLNSDEISILPTISVEEKLKAEKYIHSKVK